MWDAPDSPPPGLCPSSRDSHPYHYQLWCYCLGTPVARANLTGTARFAAMDRHSGQFYAVKATANPTIDVLCQYRAVTPCPTGYRFYWDGTGTEGGLSSCLKFVWSDSYSNAESVCGVDGEGGQPRNPAVLYRHLMTLTNVNGAQSTPLMDFYVSLAALTASNLPANGGDYPGVYWTGALLSSSGEGGGGPRPQWVDGRPFDAGSRVLNPWGYTPTQLASGE